MAETARGRATARVEAFTIDRVEVTSWGDINQAYVPGEISANGAITLADRTTMDFHTHLTAEERGALFRLCDAINERVLRELAEGL